MNKNKVVWIVLFSLLIPSFFLIKSANPSKEKPTTNNSKVTYEIIDSTKNCAEALEEIYQDDEYVYYLPCIKSKNITIQFSDGSSYLLSEVLNQNKIGIQELIEKGLEVIRYPITERVDDSYVEVIPSHAKDFISSLKDDFVLLDENEIVKYNQAIREKADMVYDLNAITSLTKKQILSYINLYQLPTLPKYDKTKTLTTANTKSILDNRNIDNIKDLKEIPKGIITNRANLKSFPTDVHFYDQYNVAEFDRVQESELLTNTPVLIIHESKDKKWNLVISPFYVGWVKKELIVSVTKEEFDYFINPEQFVIVTDVSTKIDGVILDMSVKLPYLGYTEKGYQVLLPIKQQDGTLTKKQVTISKDKAHIGYLPYTKRNVYIQAFKYEGVKYSWSGQDSGVDCSSYVSNVYRTFGIQFPRNTSSQNKSVGKIISLVNKTQQEKLKIIRDTNPSLLYQNGHVMIYLGQKNGKHYIIHASGSTMKVTFTELKEGSSYLKAIHRVITIG